MWWFHGKVVNFLLSFGVLKECFLSENVFPKIQNFNAGIHQSQKNSGANYKTVSTYSAKMCSCFFWKIPSYCPNLSNFTYGIRKWRESQQSKINYFQ